MQSGCKSNSRKSSTTKVGECISFSYSLPTVWAFDGIENKHDVYRGKDCMKKFCKYLKKHAIEIINSEKKNMISWINKNPE